MPERSQRNEPRLRLRVTAAAETQLRAGHPWVYESSVRELNRDGEPGELAVIYDRKDKFLAVGFYDPESPIRVRVLHTGKPVQIDAGFWSARLDGAVKKREGWFDESTTGYRIINGESDGWPGLVLDRYGGTLVIKIYTVAWLSRLEDVSRMIRERLKPERIVLRSSRNLQHAGTRGADDGRILHGDAINGVTTFLETGLRFEADVVRGQKTGFFLDQRENRRAVESLARGGTVLNAFSFSGGFSLYAARGGAKSVTDLDISAHALASAQRNFKLNSDVAAVTECLHERVQGDAFEWLAANASRKFDLIVLDPPSLAKRESEREGAIRAYGRLTASGVSHMARGGVLVACSCSAHVSAEEFFSVVKRSAARSGRRFVELRTTGHAPDHAATFKEAEYLKGIYLRFD
ncbi:MAG TPA: class I SAM-dependent methyltransferase [Verrucomicrobiota bacterium]|nr:class I SAM-dependent methyltransferase [Verrucomicrobiota bacterium]